MSYTIDIFRGKLKPAASPADFALFVAFFPQLVAGPIERASALLPQIETPRRFALNVMYEGAWLILWGLFKKVFVADNLAVLVNATFASQAPYEGAMVLVSLYAFALQVYCDFSGYSDMARGLAKCMGFELRLNFNLPYFAVNPQDFWRRWHMSLSSWLRDYLYVPLGGSKGSSLRTFRNLVITMLLGGLWHGAAWTFVVWGAYHGALLVLHRLALLLPLPAARLPRGLAVPLKVLLCFHAVCLGWLLFRAESLAQVMDMLVALGGNFRVTPGFGLGAAVRSLVWHAFVLCAVEIVQRRTGDDSWVLRAPLAVRVGVSLVVFYSIVVFGVSHGQSFIYFQF